MKIKFDGKFKSLKEFESDELTDFVVITGKNGSGKSQLVECITDSFQSVHNSQFDRDFKLFFNPPIHRIQKSDLKYNVAGLATSLDIKKKIDHYSTQFIGLQSDLKKLFAVLLDKHINLKDFLLTDVDNFKNQLEEMGLNIADLYNEKGLTHHDVPEEVKLKSLQKTMRSDVDLFEVVSIIKNQKNKPVNEIDKADFFDSGLNEKFIDSSDLFRSEIELIFLNYIRRFHNNAFLNFNKQRFGEDNNSVEDSEFQELYPEPWVVMNKILEDHNVDFKILAPNLKKYNEELNLEVHFIKNDTNIPLSYNALSSGEQIIIGLLLKLFTVDYYDKDLKFPELIVLDEPDVHLHPTMSKLLIDVLFESFVKRLGIKVIMTTHSATTVALAPDDCIYEMSNTPNSSLSKVIKDYALGVLTGNIPTLSIDYKNHKQVLLESPTDVKYFQTLFNKLNSEEKLNYKLYFISNEMGRSNSDWVVNTVGKLREGGVSRAFGIIDWDGKNTKSAEVLVHGESMRYSIENYVCDPIYLAILFLETKIDHGIKAELAFDTTYNQYHLANENNERLQNVWNWFVEKIQTKFPALKSSQSVEIVYYNDKKVSVPGWFKTIRGHDLEEKIKETFPALKSKYTSEGLLQNELTTIMAKSYPLVPMESIELLKELCT
ncbi:ATP-binding protein [Mucilaginibacter sp.]|jgi:AAA15 family ATPase/GTPase|uniref:ATP-binding protein n=1 Tax=Mucilaginibacter sp. TaxID=1882438 RepID=UPI002C73733A|nr:ATP-binding protein [Mucilaginibacter sp.]HTI59260.1 ATP-binding protein [Mucilaginibacter sp.]